VYLGVTAFNLIILDLTKLLAYAIDFITSGLILSLLSNILQ